jgi:DNA-directed RNA polymerase specialized sigma24 family protein
MRLAKIHPVALSPEHRVADMKQFVPDFYSIYDQYHDRLKRFVVITMVKYEWIADDIVQEAFSRVYSKLNTLGVYFKRDRRNS